VKVLQNQPQEASHFLCQILLEKSFEIFLEKFFGRSNIFTIFKRQSSLSNIFYDRNQTLQAEAVSDTVRIG